MKVTHSMTTSHVRVFLLVMLLGTVGHSVAQAGSPLPHPLLGQISRVELSVSTGDLGWKPIPGLDLRALKEEMTDLSRSALRNGRLEIGEPSEAHLLIVVEHAWEGENRDSVAILVSASLNVLAQPVDITTRDSVHGRQTLAIWEQQSLSLGAASSAHETILTELASALDRLTEERQQAQRK